MFGAVGFLLFSYAAWLQLNDPDPARWIAMYGAAAIACLSVFWSARVSVIRTAVAVVALAWSMSLFAGLERFPEWSDLIADRPMVGDHVEEAREAIGLLIAGIWVGALAGGYLRGFFVRPLDGGPPQPTGANRRHSDAGATAARPARKLQRRS